MAKKKLTIEDVLVPKDEIPYEVPENWCWVKLGSICEIIRGVSYKKTDVKDYESNTCMIARGGNIQNGLLVECDDNVYIDFNLVKEKQFLKKGDVLIVASTGSNKLIGKAALIDNDYSNKAFGAFIINIRPNDKINKRYFGYYFLSHYYTNYIRTSAAGVNINNINGKHLENILFPIPPLAEQVRIVNRIESLFDKVDKAAGLVDEARKDFEKRRAAILERAFSGELTKKWREENGVSDDSQELLNSIKEERLSICQSKKEKSDITKMFEEDNFIYDKYPKGWLNLKANMICHNITCGKTPTGKIIEKGEVPYLKVYNIVNNKIDFHYKPQFIDMETLETKLKSSILKPNDVIMNIVGPPLRKIALIPDEYEYWGMNQAIVRFRTISNVLPKYLYYCLLNEDTLKEVINETKGVVGQANISVTQSRSLDIPIPPLKEQEEIVRVLDKVLTKEEEISELSDLANSIDVIKKAILAKAFKGELGSNDLDEGSSINLLEKLIEI